MGVMYSHTLVTLLWLEEGSRESVDAKCRQLTAPWVREEYASQLSDLDAMDIEDLHICQFYENYDKVEDEIMLPPSTHLTSFS